MASGPSWQDRRVESLEFDVDAERLRHDPAVREIVGGMAAHASPTQMGRFETRWLAAPEDLRALAELSGHRIDRVRASRATMRSSSIWTRA